MELLREETYRRIADLMYGTVGLSLPESKKMLISYRLGPRIQKLGLAGFDSYVDLLAEESVDGELQVAIDLLTTHETYFFRESRHFGLIEREFAARKPGALAVWSAATSFGDEAYSVAMVLADMARRGALTDAWSVLATDVSDSALRCAVEGVYPADRLRDVSPDRLRRYCLRGEGEAEGLIRIGDALREHVRFGWCNLCQPLDDLECFDVIFLRNVLIYFDVPTKRAVLNRVLERLSCGGLFFVGSAEGRIHCDWKMDALMPGAFRKAE